jgi:hypothetical protein
LGDTGHPAGRTGVGQPGLRLEDPRLTELVPALRNMVEAARQMRSALEAGAGSWVATPRQTTSFNWSTPDPIKWHL